LGSTFFLELGSQIIPIVGGNGTTYIYNYGAPANGTVKVQPNTVNVTVKADKVTGATTTNMAAAGVTGAAVGGLISVGGILGVLAMQKRSGSSSSADPYPDPKDSAASSKGGGRGSLQGSEFGTNEQGVKRSSGGEELPKESKFAIKEDGLPKKKSREGAVQYRESDFAIKENGVKSASRRGSLQSATTEREDYTGKATGRLRESPTLASTGQTKVRESPTKSSLRESPTLSSKGQTMVRESPSKASLGRTSVRESPSKGSAIRESPTEPSRGQQERATGDVNGDGTPDNVAPKDTSSGHASGRESSAPSVSERSPDYAQQTGQTSSLRESPSKASLGKTSVRESPTLPTRDAASGQASGKRLGVSSSSPDSPLGKVQEGLDKKDQASEAFEKGDKPTQEQAAKGSPRSTRGTDQTGSDQGKD
jgi:hypothetical protein